MTNDNIEAIKAHRITHFRSQYQTHVEFESTEAFFDYVYRKINLADFLGLPADRHIPCIFCSKPGDTASIYTEGEYGVWKYQCHSDEYCPTAGVALNICQVVEILGQYKTRYEALEYIKACFNISVIDDDWVKAQREEMNSIISSIVSLDDGSFRDICPQANRNLVNAKSAFCSIVQIARDSISPKSRDLCIDGFVVFGLSRTELSKKMKAGGKRKETVFKYVKMLIYHHMLVPVQEDHDIYKKLNAKNKYKNHTQYYYIPSWVITHMIDIEKQAYKWKENGYRLAHFSYEEVYRTEGKQIADMLFPQKLLNPDPSSILNTKDKAYEEITYVTLDLIVDKGYCTEKEIHELIAGTEAEREKTVHRCINSIVDANGLVRERATKALKEHFKITAPGYPIIIHTPIAETSAL